MPTRPLGRSGLSTAPLVLGGNVFGWTADEAASHAVLDAFVDGGFTLIDTADAYSRWVPGHLGGESESVIGRWLRASGKRGRVLIATKVALPMGEAGDGRSGLSRRWIRQAVHDSLRRLQTDHIDLYQAHVDDADTALEETLSAFAELIQQGLVRAIGASNYSAPRLAEALATSARLGLPRYEVLQPGHNLADRAGYEGALAALDEVAASQRATPAQVALAWQMTQPGITAPIASATSVAQLEELMAATRLVLSAQALSRLDSAATP